MNSRTVPVTAGSTAAFKLNLNFKFKPEPGRVKSLV